MPKPSNILTQFLICSLHISTLKICLARIYIIKIILLVMNHFFMKATVLFESLLQVVFLSLHYSDFSYEIVDICKFMLVPLILFYREINVPELLHFEVKNIFSSISYRLLSKSLIKTLGQYCKCTQN